jgi:hypothetical protein
MSQITKKFSTAATLGFDEFSKIVKGKNLLESMKDIKDSLSEEDNEQNERLKD